MGNLDSEGKYRLSHKDIQPSRALDNSWELSCSLSFSPMIDTVYDPRPEQPIIDSQQKVHQTTHYFFPFFVSLSLYFFLSLSLSLTLVFHGVPGNKWYLPLVAISISAQVNSDRYLCKRSIVISVRRFVSLAISWAFNIGRFFSNFRILSMRSLLPSVVDVWISPCSSIRGSNNRF